MSRRPRGARETASAEHARTRFCAAGASEHARAHTARAPVGGVESLGAGEAAAGCSMTTGDKPPGCRFWLGSTAGRSLVTGGEPRAIEATHRSRQQWARASEAIRTSCEEWIRASDASRRCCWRSIRASEAIRRSCGQWVRASDATRSSRRLWAVASEAMRTSGEE